MHLDESRSHSSILKDALQFPVIYDFGPGSLFSRFSCVPGCQDCCGYAYFLPSEVELLPARIKEQLAIRDGKHEVNTRNGRCIFYRAGETLFCTIHDFKPVRCRIYPFFPLIVDRKVVITLEPALKMKNSESDRHRNCPGIGKEGKSLEETLDDCLNFLKKLVEVPDLFSTVILDSERFNRIRNDRWFIEQNGNIYVE